eukprot:8597324-Pyramimonas_sp.AAC.1
MVGLARISEAWQSFSVRSVRSTTKWSTTLGCLTLVGTAGARDVPHKPGADGIPGVLALRGRMRCYVGVPC